jgi:hypothetical protein
MGNLDGKPIMLDIQQRPLKNQRVYYHPDCQYSFTDLSIQEMFGLDVKVGNDKQILGELSSYSCPGCIKIGHMNVTMQGLIRIFPNLTPDDPSMEDSMKQTNLKKVYKYVQIKAPVSAPGALGIPPAPQGTNTLANPGIAFFFQNSDPSDSL